MPSFCIHSNFRQYFRRRKMTNQIDLKKNSSGRKPMYAYSPDHNQSASYGPEEVGQAISELSCELLTNQIALFSHRVLKYIRAENLHSTQNTWGKILMLNLFESFNVWWYYH